MPKGHDSFLAEHPAPVLIDEVQYAPGLFRSLKLAIDAQRQRKGRYILTGSQKFSLMKEVSESLAGRCALLNLPGLSVAEIKRSGWTPGSPSSHVELLARGCFPELWAEPGLPARDFYQSYLGTYLERDLRQSLNVGSLRDFERFLRACAARSAQLLNKSELARDVGISQTTAGEWLSALEAGNQITLLEPYFGNVGKRLVKSPKLYFNDTGLLCFLLALEPASLGKSPLTGAVWESFLLSELNKLLELRHPDWTLWFYRDQQNREADFLVQGPHDRIRVMDAKWSESPGSDAFSKLSRVAEILLASTGVNSAEQAVLARNAGVHKFGEDRYLASGFELANFPLLSEAEEQR